MAYLSIVDRPSSSEITIQRIDKDIPGAKLQEPLEAHAIPALQWWILCHGIKKLLQTGKGHG